MSEVVITLTLDDDETIGCDVRGDMEEEGPEGTQLTILGSAAAYMVASLGVVTAGIKWEEPTDVEH